MKLLLPTMAFALLAMPFAGAHAPAGPDPLCTGDVQVHHYATSSQTPVFGFTTVVDGANEPACAATGDGEPEYGVGGALLLASHHDADVCVVDDALGASTPFVVGADHDGDGLTDADTGVVTGCVTVTFGAGADGGWWVFIGGPATTGHVY